jgi:hypothetical protein
MVIGQAGSRWAGRPYFTASLTQRMACIHYQKRAYIVMTSIEFGGSNDNSTTNFTTFTQESHNSRCMRRTGRVLRRQFLLVSPGFPDRIDPWRRTGHPCLSGDDDHSAERIDVESKSPRSKMTSVIALLPYQTRSTCPG